MYLVILDIDSLSIEHTKTDKKQEQQQSKMFPKKRKRKICSTYRENENISNKEKPPKQFNLFHMAFDAKTSVSWECKTKVESLWYIRLMHANAHACMHDGCQASGKGKIIWTFSGRCRSGRAREWNCIYAKHINRLFVSNLLDLVMDKEEKVSQPEQNESWASAKWQAWV